MRYLRTVKGVTRINRIRNEIVVGIQAYKSRITIRVVWIFGTHDLREAGQTGMGRQSSVKEKKRKKKRNFGTQWSASS